MGYFYKGQHFSYSSNYGPNEGVGNEDDMAFHDLARKIRNSKNRTYESSNDLDNDVISGIKNPKRVDIEKQKKYKRYCHLRDKLLSDIDLYLECRDSIKDIIKILKSEYNDKFFSDLDIQERMSSNICVDKLLNYYFKKY